MNERLTLHEASRLLGCPVKCLRGRYVREGLLPWPDARTLTWPAADVLALKAWLDARRRGDTAAPRPQHATGVRAH